MTIGVDIGTTTITAVAVDALSGATLAAVTALNEAETTSAPDKARGRSEWEARRMAQVATRCLGESVAALGDRRPEVAGIGLTGQQHGVVLVDGALEPLTPFINWQDRRSEEPLPGRGQTAIQRAVELAGPEAPRTAGCALAAGFMGTTLLWLQETGGLPAGATACFAADFVAARLAAARPITDPTNGASSGLFSLPNRTWDDALIARLGLPRTLFPEVREAGETLGGLSPAAADACGLPSGTPVFVGLGDNQASVLGSMAAPLDTVLVNVGTGAQVSCCHAGVVHAPPLETRPFPRGGFLLVHAGLSGGRSYAALHRFFAQAAEQVLGQPAPRDLYAVMNALAAGVPAGADGLRCDPCFAGSRSDPSRRAIWSGMSEATFTPAHMARALLEGMARGFREGYENIVAATGTPRRTLVGAGNGLRENPVLARIVAEEFGMELLVPAHREEAAYGAALIAAVGAGIYPDLAGAAQVIRYETRVNLRSATEAG